MRILLTLLLSCVMAGAAYVPGVGIPDPANYWDGLDPIDDVRPADPAEWPSAANTNFYYIDNTHPSATDVANPYGYPDQPRASMDFIESAPVIAGKTFVIRGGPYTPGYYDPIIIAGTSNSPVWISGDPVSRTHFENRWRISSASYVYVENICWTNESESHFNLHTNGTSGHAIHHIAVRNCEAVGLGVSAGSGSLFRNGDDVGVPNQYVVHYQSIARNGGSITEGGDPIGFGFGKACQWYWWIQCLSYNMGGDGFASGHDANYTSYDLFWDRCESYDNGENAMDLKEVHSAVVSGCYFHDFVDRPDKDGGPAYVSHYGPDPQYGSYNVFVFNCLVNNSEIGLQTTDTGNAVGGTNLWWVGNVIHDCDLATSGYGDSALRMWHNTIYNCGRGMLNSGVNTFYLANNIISGTSTNRDMNSLSVTNSTANNECYYDAVNIQWGNYGDYTAVADWISGTPDGDGSIEADPLFVNAGATNFNLQASSPCINAGTNVITQLEADYLAVFGWALNYVDRNGNARGASPDIGAYEYTAGGSNPGSINTLRATGRVRVTGSLKGK